MSFSLRFTYGQGSGFGKHGLHDTEKLGKALLVNISACCAYASSGTEEGADPVVS